MTKHRVLSAATLVLAATVLSGCMPKMSIEKMKEMMQVERPAELNQLNFMVGTWEGSGEAKFAGMDQALKTTSTTTASWDLDKMVLIERGKYSMEELGDMEGINIWSYDARSGHFRTLWVDSTGGRATGTATYNKKTDTWHFKSKGSTEHGTMYGKGTMKMVGGMMDWTWSESAMMGMMKISEFKGTAKKVK